MIKQPCVTLMHSFYENVTAASRAAEAPSGRAHVVAVESVTWDDFFEVGFSDLPGGPTGRALSYHYYSAPNIEGAEGQVGMPQAYVSIRCVNGHFARVAYICRCATASRTARA